MATDAAIQIEPGSYFQSNDFDSSINRGFLVVEIIADLELPGVFAPNIVDVDDLNLEIPSSSSNVSADLIGSVTSSGGNIIDDSWALVSGPSTGYTINLITGGINVVFDVPGVWVFRHSATVSNGVDSATDYQDTTITVENELSAPPEAIITFESGTTVLPSGLFGFSRVVSLFGAQSIAPSGNPIVEYIFEYRVGTDWVIVPPQASPETSITLFDSGNYEFRLKVGDSVGIYSDYSASIFGNISLIRFTGTFELPDNLEVNTTGNSAVATIEVLLGGTFLIGSHITFDIRITASKYWVEYDPNNVQTLPSPISFYDVSESFSIPVDTLNNDMSISSHRDYMAAALVSAIRGHSRVIGCVLNDVVITPSGASVLIGAAFNRGTTESNQNLNTFTSPSLARKIKVVFRGTNEVFQS